MRRRLALLGAAAMMGFGAGGAFGETPDVAVVEGDPVSVPTGTAFAEASVSCPPGRLVTGGGWKILPAVLGLPMISSQPLAGGTSWGVALANQSGGTFALTAFALCAAVDPAGSGPTGLTGAAGPQGTNGATGPTGSAGAAGAEGARGLKGATGARGPRGAAAAAARGLTRARCLALRKAHRSMPGACTTRFKIRPAAR